LSLACCNSSTEFITRSDESSTITARRLRRRRKENSRNPNRFREEEKKDNERFTNFISEFKPKSMETVSD